MPDAHQIHSVTLRISWTEETIYKERLNGGEIKTGTDHSLVTVMDKRLGEINLIYYQSKWSRIMRSKPKS